MQSLSPQGTWWASSPTGPPLGGWWARCWPSRHDEWAEGRRYLAFTDDLDTETLPSNKHPGGSSLNNINKDDAYSTT